MRGLPFPGCTHICTGFDNIQGGRYRRILSAWRRHKNYWAKSQLGFKTPWRKYSSYPLPISPRTSMEKTRGPSIPRFTETFRSHQRTHFQEANSRRLATSSLNALIFQWRERMLALRGRSGSCCSVPQTVRHTLQLMARLHCCNFPNPVSLAWMGTFNIKM